MLLSYTSLNEEAGCWDEPKRDQGGKVSLHTNKYSFKNPGRWNFFLWKATAGQFKRLGNVYFLTIGFIMFIGYYTE